MSQAVNHVKTLLWALRSHWHTHTQTHTLVIQYCRCESGGFIYCG